MSRVRHRDVSIVVPVYDEEDNVGQLHREIAQAMEPTGRTWEVLYVDDGSKDGTPARLARLAATDARVTVLRLRRNYGQSAALQAGFDRAVGAIIVSLDADLQNDPADIPRLLEVVERDGAVACGWRRRRNDKLLTRRLPSQAANWLISRLTAVRIHDNGCTLKAYPREVVKKARLYSDLHRFLGPLLSLSGCRYVEIPVNHRPRRFGTSKYGLSRIWKVFLDLIALKMFLRFVAHPAAWFFLLALPFLAGGAAAGGASLWLWAGQGTAPIVMPSVAMLSAFAATHLLLAGLVAELVVSTGDFRETQPILIVRENRKEAA